MTPADDPLHRVFVYGTLRQGGSNHFRMAGGRFVMRGHVKGRLYRIDWYPGLVLDAGAGEVCGEVYEVTGDQLQELDVFEGLSAGEIEGSEYRRVKTGVINAGGSTEAWIWEWLGPVREADRIPEGDWLRQAG